jgi:hypothetical protein
VIKKTIRGQSAGERCAVRQESTKPLVLFNADRIAEGGDLRAEARVARNGERAKTVNAAAGATRLEPGPKGTRESRLFSFSKRARQRRGGTPAEHSGTFSGLFVANRPFRSRISRSVPSAREPASR